MPVIPCMHKQNTQKETHAWRHARKSPYAHLQPSHSACIEENVTVSRGCLSGGDRADGLTGAPAALLPSTVILRARVCVLACAPFWLWCMLSLTDTGRWEVPACCAALQQMHIGCDTAEPAVWQACDRAELVLNNFLGSITLPKHWTRHLPFPIYPSWSQSPLLFTNGVLIGPNLSLSID